MNVRILSGGFKFRRCFNDPPVPPAPPAPPKMIDEAKVNEIVQQRLAEQKKQFEKREQALTGKLQELDLTVQQKSALESQLEELRIQSLSKEEQIKAKADKDRKDLEAKAKTYETEAKGWRERYSSEKVQSELLSAAEKEEAFRSQQIVDLLKGRSRLAEMIDQSTNKPTGKFQTLVSIEQVKDGQSVTIDVSPADAVKAMKETDPNLFKSNMTGGLGRGPNLSSVGSTSLAKMPVADFVKGFQAGSLPRA